MYKILGMTSILAASVLTGFVMSGELNERTKILKAIRQSAISIKSDLEYRAPSIEECFAHRKPLFSSAQKYMTEESLKAEAALKRACDAIKHLTKEDREIICAYAENLSKEEIGGQIANIMWFIEQLSERIRDAEAEYISKGRLYRSGGALAGIGFIIFLL